jgi:competence protein ComEC
MLFAGDAAERRTEELLRLRYPDIDLLKVPHHGRANINSREFIERISPTYAIITAGQSDSAVRNALNAVGARSFYSGLGNVHFVTDGLTLRPMIGVY